MQQITTRNRYILINLAPTLLLSMLIGGSFLWLHISDLKRTQLEEGAATLNNFSYLVQTSLNGAPEDSIQAITYYILKQSKATSVSIYDEAGNTISTAGPAMNPVPSGKPVLLAQPHHLATSKSIRFSTPLQEALLSPISTLTKHNQQLKNWGWIEIEIPSHETSVKKYKAITFTLITIFASWLLHLTLILIQGHRIDITIQKFSQAFSSLKSGNFGTSIKVDGPADLGVLETEFNSMCYALQHALDESQKHMQQATDDINETLETIEIQNIELDLARKKAQKASLSKSAFLASMSHEIRTPLNGIIGFTKLLSQSPMQARQNEQLRIIDKSAHDLLSIINDILDFSKIEAGKLALDQSPFDLRDAIEEIIDMLAPLAYEKNLELVSLYYSDTPHQIVGDALRTKQIITNLVSNAIKFSHKGNITIRTMIESESDTELLLKISVSDQGIGLSQMDQQSLFQAFSQVDSSSKTAHNGTGLGLAIAQHLTRLMQGEIGCTSQQKKGSTFWFTFRVKKDPMAEKSPSQTCCRDERIALYDINSETRSAVSQSIQRLEFHCDEFESLDALTNGIRLQIDSGTPYHAAILSLNSPQDSNPITSITIESIEKVLKCPAIVFSNAHETPSFQSLLEKSASLVLHKPVKHQQIYSALQTLLVRRKPVSQPVPTITATKKLSGAPQILAVDDTETNLQLLCIFLEQLGARATPCESGKMAIELMKKSHYDLIFMDYRMPEINGIQATKIIRGEEKAGQHTPIIALTAHAMASEKEALLAAGMDDCITKPVDENQLYITIKKWLPSNTQTTTHPADALNILNSKENNIVNIQESISLIGGSPKVAEEIFNKLIVSLRHDRETILSNKQNPDLLLNGVHRLHGACQYCGVPILRAQAKKLEKLLNSLPLQRDEIDRQTIQLIIELDRVIDWSQRNSTQLFYSI